MATPAAAFGPGILIASRTDITIPSPINIGYAQEFNLEAAGTTKQLFGQNQYPLAAARGTIKVTGKFKSAVVSGLAWNALMYGMSSLSTSSIVAWNIDSTYTTSTSSTQVTVANSSVFDADLGVRYSTTNLPLQRVSTGSEATGKYSIGSTAPGIYNFAAGDSTGGAAGGTNLKITYTTTNGSGQALAVTNQAIGTTPTFQLDYYTNFNQPAAKPLVFRIFSCIGAKHAMGFKLEDFMIPEFDFDVFADASGRVFTVWCPEVA